MMGLANGMHGSGGSRPRLAPRVRSQLRRRAKRRLLALYRWASRRGVSLREISSRMGLAPQTISDWVESRRLGALEVAARGRRCRDAPPDVRGRVEDLLRETHGRMGVPSLKRLFPDVSHRELRSMVRAYRADHAPEAASLTWTVSGRVWAADYTPVNPTIDGMYGQVLSVRDLGSRCQLLALPVEEAPARATVAALAALFAAHGAPLVLKSDNGSHFTGRIVKDLLDAEGGAHLCSPPQTPWYNGSAEAGIGGLKTRTHHIAAAHGRPGRPTCDDVEMARLESNEQARPWGESGPSPEERWATRPLIAPAERRQFLAAVAAALEAQRPCMPEGSSRPADNGQPAALNATNRATVARRTIVRALVERGYLTIRRSLNSSTELRPLLSEH